MFINLVFNAMNKDPAVNRVKAFIKRLLQVPSIIPSVADPESAAFLTPGSRIRNRLFADPGSQTHIFESLVIIFWVKSYIIL
jgi:hypothetical protein